MSSIQLQEKKHDVYIRDFDPIGKYENFLLKLIIPYSDVFTYRRKTDIYTGNENLPFNKRHPIFKALMKLEFEDALTKQIVND